MRINPFKAKKKLSNNFLLVQSLINFPIHYQPKKFSQDPNDNNKYILMNSFPNILDKNSFKPKQEMHGSLSQYAIKKNKNRISIIKKLQREKIDILLNNVMDKANYNIRDYNYKNSNKELPKIKQLTSGTKEIIKDDILVKYNNFLRHKNAFIKSPLKYNKEYIWSQKILEEKRLKEYRRIYSLKHLKGEDKFTFENWKNSLKIVKNIIEEKKKRNKTFSGPYFSPKKYK